MNKRTINTQGVTFSYNIGYLKVFQLNNKKGFRLPTFDNLTPIENIEHFLNSIEDIENYTLVINNTSKIDGFLFSINWKNYVMQDLKQYVKK